MNINDSMLFRWVGYDIEYPDDANKPAPHRKPLSVEPKLTKKQGDTYFDYLDDALNPKRGLRVASYSEFDKVGGAEPSTDPKPCLFFTEQAAGTSERHWRLYGRLGFGFAKRFIFRLGGRPLIYTGGRNDPVVSAVTFLRKNAAGLYDKKGELAKQHLELLARFIKCTRLPRLETGKSKIGTGKIKPVFAPPCKLDILPNDNFPDYNSIRFLSEREWRLPVNENDSIHWHKDTKSGNPEWWFRAELGMELQLIILPSNYFLTRALELVRKRVGGKMAKPIQLISAQVLQKL